MIREYRDFTIFTLHNGQMSQNKPIDSPFCMLLGITVAEYQVGRCKVEMPIAEKLFNRAQMVHGGVSFTLGDVAMGFAAAQGGAYSLTKSIEIEYSSPARGKMLSAIATITKQVENRVYCRCEVFADDVKVCSLRGEFRIKKQPSAANV
ncbi:MAG: hypothetical protein ACI91G_000090 [Gammaproteobacteria bacterium]|jgi:uncharacterized protein (TIGR00369 family)